MLTLNPDTRISTQEALDHDFFRLEPVACTSEGMPKIEKECHEYDIRKMIMMNREKELAKRQNTNQQVGATNQPSLLNQQNTLISSIFK